MTEPTEQMREEAARLDPGWGLGADEAYREGFTAGMAHERARVVAWLREKAIDAEWRGHPLPYHIIPSGAAALIEEADHWSGDGIARLRAKLGEAGRRNTEASTDGE